MGIEQMKLLHFDNTELSLGKKIELTDINGGGGGRI